MMTLVPRLVYVCMTFRATVSHLSKTVFCDLYVCLRLVQPFRLFWKCYTLVQRLVTFVVRFLKIYCLHYTLDTFGATVS